MEEMLADSYGSGSIRKGIRYPFVEEYGLRLGCLMLEGGVGSIVVGVSWIGAYFFSDYLMGE